MNHCQEIASKTGMPPICAACNMGPCPNYRSPPTPRELELMAEIEELRKPVDMVLYCPKCGKQHIDAPDAGANECVLDKWQNDAVMEPWSNPPHRSHLCVVCRHIWRPADVATNGVAAIKTKGKADS